MTNDNNLAPPGAFNSVLSEIAAERERQIAKGYDAAHDDAQEPEDLAEKAKDRLEKSLTVGGDREALIEAAALIVAEVARIDRAKVVGNG